MLKRCSPRSSSSFVSGMGSSVISAPPCLPVKNASSSCSVPRATVSSTSGRALDPFANSALSRSGMYFGWLCMSCLQPAAARRQKAADRRQKLRRDFIDFTRIESLQELQRPLTIELRIVRLDQQEELVAARVLEAWHVEDRVIRHRQAVEDDHADHGRERRDQDRHLEGHRNELRPAVERLAGDVDRV